jgi:hypothetical protein
LGLTNFLDEKVIKKRKPRLWKEKEWAELTPKERIWIFYKHHWTMKNIGSGEVDQITNPVKELILYGGILIILFKDPVLVVIGAVCYVVGNTFLQWYIGTWKDKKDLIALEQEISNRRNLVFREMRKGILQYKYKRKTKK